MIKMFDDAEWIIAADAAEECKDKLFIYKQTFETDRCEKALLAVSAHSQYAVYINGRYVDAGQYSGYEDRQYYDELDITGFVRRGKNELTVWHYVCGQDFSTGRKLIPGVIFSVIVDGKCVCVTDESCLSCQDKRLLGLCELISPQIGFNFDFDSTVTLPPFKNSVLAKKEKNLYKRPVKKLITDDFVSGELIETGIFSDANKESKKAFRMQNAVMKKQSVIKNKNGCGFDFSAYEGDGVWLLYDCSESAGFLHFSIDAEDVTEILIGYGEHLYDGRVRTQIGSRNFCCSYKAHKGKNEFFYPLYRLGLRYLCFFIYSKKGRVDFAGIRKQRYPVALQERKFSDLLQQKIYDVGVKTLSLCMHEHYEDSIWREQSLYTMDSRIQILCGFYAFKGFDFQRANLLLMSYSLRSDGLLELCPPGKVCVDIPSYTAVFIREIYEYLEYSGDMSLGEELFETADKIIEGFYRRIQKNGLLPLYKGKEYWNFYEWRKGLSGLTDNELDRFEVITEERYDLPLNAFVSDAFFCYEKICDMLNRKCSAKIKSARGKISVALNEMFWDDDDKAYLTSTDCADKHTLTQALMLYIDAVPEERKKSVTEHIVNRDFIPASLAASVYLFDSLIKNGVSKEYVWKEIKRIWGGLIAKGAETFWETEIGADDFQKAGSLCHGWSAVPVYILGKYYSG